MLGSHQRRFLEARIVSRKLEKSEKDTRQATLSSILFVFTSPLVNQWAVGRLTDRI